MKPSECLRQAKALIEQPNKWCQGVIYKAPDNYSPLGATVKIDPPIAHDACNYLRKVLGDEIGTWNDMPERTHAEVMSAFDAAIVLAESKGS